MTDLERKLKHQLYRLDCPEPLELGEYRLKMLPVSRQETLTQHLQVCPHCQRELASLDRMLADFKAELEPGLVERVRVWIAERLPGGAAGLTPAFGLRGDSGSGQVYDYQAGEAQITIEIQENSQGRKTLLGLVLGGKPAGLVAALWQQGELLQQVPVDELGNFVILDISPGAYDLIVSGPDEEYHLQSLQV
jgi:hypothetical protein